MDDNQIDYETSPTWSDVVPIPQNDGGPNPLAAIAYTDGYSQAMSYLRAVMASNEMSERVLDLTEHVIVMNPAHYTVWLYRAATLEHLKSDPLEELEWLNLTSLKHLKNYQIWHHRHMIMSRVSSLPSNELPFLAEMLSKDEKNYHVWSYRQWLVSHFDLCPRFDKSSSELEFTAHLIEEDVRNNSAWNHRFFVIFGQGIVKEGSPFDPKSIDESAWEHEIDFAKRKIARAPQNQAAWNYLGGVLKKRGKGLEDIKDFAAQFADIENADKVQSSYALDVLAEIWAEEKEEAKAKKALVLLADRFDPIRKNYWKWREQSLESGIAAA